MRQALGSAADLFLVLDLVSGGTVREALQREGHFLPPFAFHLVDYDHVMSVFCSAVYCLCPECTNAERNTKKNIVANTTLGQSHEPYGT